MTHSTATEPVPAALAGDLAHSYNSDTGATVPFTYDMMAPDGSISATASDMARFMAAHLSADGGKLLSGQMMATMHTRSFSADPRLGGYAHGFTDRTINGHQVLLHGGSWEGFESALILVPDCHLGLFIATNGSNGTDVLGKVVPAFYDRFLPRISPAAPAGGRVVVPEAGFYMPLRHNESTVEKLVTLLSPYRMTINSDGSINFWGRHFTPGADGLYEAGNDHMTVIVGSDGQQYVVTDEPAFVRLPWWRTLPFNIGVLLFVVAVALSALLVPLTRLRRRRPRADRTWRLGRTLTSIALGLGVAFLALVFVELLVNTGDFLYGAPTSFALVLALPLLVLGLTAGGLYCSVRGWNASGVTTLARVHQATLVAGLAAFTWFIVEWNLLGWQY